MDTYINQFDSIYHADLQDKGEVEVTQVLLSGDTIVLPLNQIADSLAVISLCTSPAFLSILHRGKITTSLYGKIGSVREYLLGNLRGVIEGNSAFIFSSLPFLYEIDGRKTRKAAQLELLRELMRCIESDDWIPDFTAYSQDYSPFAEQIVNWCLGLHNLIHAIDPTNYRKNLVRAQKKDLTMWVEETFAAMDDRGDENIPAYRDILRGISRPNRTDYQNAINAARGSYGDPFCDRLQATVNYCYNQNLSYLICDRARLVVPQQYSFLTEQQQPISMGFEGSLLFDRVYRPVKGVFRRAVLDWDALNAILIEMDAAQQAGETLESVQMQLNNQYCIDYTEFAGRLCCTANAMDTLAAGKLCGEQTAEHSGDDSFRIRQE